MTDNQKYSRLSGELGNLSLYAVGEFSKEKVLSVRVEESLYNLLEGLKDKWGSKTVSNTLRTLISMYFLPVMYRVEWETLKPEYLTEYLKEQREQGVSMELESYNQFIGETTRYLSFLKEAVEMSRISTNYLETTYNNIEGILREMTEKIQEILVEPENQVPVSEIKRK